MKAISDTVEHLVPRPLPARPRNSIWRLRGVEFNGVEFNGVYILYFVILFFDLFILFGW